MLPSLYSGISGLRANQQKLNVIANNIANSSTTGFKSQAMNFSDMMSQTLSDESAPVEDGVGGINAKQSGLGVKVAGINTDFSEGSQQTTNRTLDLMLSKGGSYFVVSVDGDNDYYTRDGSFTIDSDGYLVTQDGHHVMGYETPGPTNTDKPTTEIRLTDDPKTNKVTSISIGTDGTITVKTKSNPDGEVVGQIALASFSNEGGLLKNGGNLYSSSKNSGDPVYGTGGTDDYGSIITGSLEMSNVDLAQQFTDMIVSTRAFQANGKIITTDDEILEDLVNLKR